MTFQTVLQLVKSSSYWRAMRDQCGEATWTTYHERLAKSSCIPDVSEADLVVEIVKAFCTVQDECVPVVEDQCHFRVQLTADKG